MCEGSRGSNERVLLSAQPACAWQCFKSRSSSVCFIRCTLLHWMRQWSWSILIYCLGLRLLLLIPESLWWHFSSDCPVIVIIGWSTSSAISLCTCVFACFPLSPSLLHSVCQSLPSIVLPFFCPPLHPDPNSLVSGNSLSVCSGVLSFSYFQFLIYWHLNIVIVGWTWSSISISTTR